MSFDIVLSDFEKHREDASDEDSNKILSSVGAEEGDEDADRKKEYISLIYQEIVFIQLTTVPVSRDDK